MSLQKRFLKSKPGCKVTFSLPKAIANGAKEVKLLGDFNNWKKKDGVQMKLKNGHFTTEMNLQPEEEMQFRYLIDNERWENDPAADKYVPTPFGVENSVVVIAKKAGGHK